MNGNGHSQHLNASNGNNGVNSNATDSRDATDGIPPSSSPIPPNNTTYYYFGYGSNMCSSILAAKGVFVEADSESCPAYVPDYELHFDLATPSIVEPSFANIRHTLGKTVHGVLHAFSHDNMMRMDQLESGGRAYIREKVRAVKYNGEEVQAYAYVCHSNNLMGLKLIDTPPSKRYLNVLIHGAEQYHVNPEYLKWLKSHPYTDYPKLSLTQEQMNHIERRTWTNEELASFAFPLSDEAHRKWEEIYPDLAISSVNSVVSMTEEMERDPKLSNGFSKEKPTLPKSNPAVAALKGIVFDFSSMKHLTDTYRKMLCGRDTALFVASRVAVDLESSSLPKSIEELSEEQKLYIDATVMDYANSHVILGHTEDRSKFNW